MEKCHPIFSKFFIINCWRAQGYTLEPIRLKGAVPTGTYDSFLRKDHSPWRIELKDVLSNKHIQIHVGNRPIPKDTTGCFLAGKSRRNDYVGDSKNAMKEILDIIQKDGSGQIEVKVINNSIKLILTHSPLFF